ncbi:MAG TPA: hypothetical protein VG366_03265 [Solirubrobacteraceae bacterium]|nr:hypothetical protein [Solirubrobacteraceae bacterium]
MVEAHLAGVWAKWQRAVEQLTTLSEEVTAFCSEPNPYGIISHENREHGRYRFEIYPAWQPGRVLRWGTIIGEIVHDFRSALDNLVWQLVVLNGREPDDGHSFPIRAEEPPEGFAVEMRREGEGGRGRVRHGPLLGVSDDALAIIEACQPYKGGNGLLLQRLHVLWNTDKHRHLAPVHVVAPPPHLLPRGSVTVLSRNDGFAGGAYVVEITVPPGTQVDVDPQPPTDITFGEPHPIVLELQQVGRVIIHEILLPSADLFPGLSGVGHP